MTGEWHVSAYTSRYSSDFWNNAKVLHSQINKQINKDVRNLKIEYEHKQLNLIDLTLITKLKGVKKKRRKEKQLDPVFWHYNHRLKAKRTRNK